MPNDEPGDIVLRQDGYLSDAVPGLWTPATLVSGHCPTGADRIAENIARGWDWTVELHAADWNRHGKRAGFLRNAEMVGARRRRVRGLHPRRLQGRDHDGRPLREGRHPHDSLQEVDVVSGRFWFWVVVCILVALVIVAFGVGMAADYMEDSVPAGLLVGVLMLAFAVLIGWLPWLVAADARWRQACADAGGVVVATDTWYTTQYVNGVPVITEHHNYACIRAEVIDP